MSVEWGFESLWLKARRYAERAHGERRGEELFPLWCAIALELLGRATLARIHPSLLADPQSGDNILYACGYGATKNPRSVPAKTVFLRCQAVVTGFTETDFAFAMSLMDRRNEELHSGSLAFADFATEHWLARYYRVCEILLEANELALEDLLGDEAKAAKAMIGAAAQDRRQEVHRRIAAHKTIFDGLDEEEKEKKRETAKPQLIKSLRPHRKVACPACGSDSAFVGGEVVSRTDARVEDDVLVWEERVLPTNLKCSVCDLELRGHEALHSVDLGGQFVVEDYVDAREYYRAEFDPADYYESGYMNE